MRLRDDIFLNSPTDSDPQDKRASLDLRALQGIGDKLRRPTDDFVMSFGEVSSPTWSIGDVVDFVTPDGIKRRGALCRPHDSSNNEWLVRVDEGLYNIVPMHELRASRDIPTNEKRAVIRDVLANTDQWLERHEPIAMHGDDFRITIDYGPLNKIPSDDAVCAYVDRKYAARVLDATPIIGGKLEVVCTKVAQMHSPSDPKSTEEPGLETEELEGTGKIAYVVESLRRVASLNSQYDFVAGTITEDAQKTTATFELRASNGDKLFLSPQGNITPVIDIDSIPAVGYLAYDGSLLVGGFNAHESDIALSAYGLNVQAGVEPPYSDGAGPLGTRDSDTAGGGYVKADADSIEVEAGPSDWVTKEQYERDYQRAYGRPATPPGPNEADLAQQRRKQRMQERQQSQSTPPPQSWMTAATDEEDGEVREEIAGPGEVVAVDQRAKDYYAPYYGDGYGKMLTRDIKRRRTDLQDEIRAAWVVNQDREPTVDETIRTMAVLFSKRTALAHINKTAQLTSAQDFIHQLMSTATTNDKVRSTLDSMVVNYISKSPSAVLEKLDKSTYPRLMFMMLQDAKEHKKLVGLHKRYVDPSKHTPSAPPKDLGQPQQQPAEEQFFGQSTQEEKPSLWQRGKEFLKGPGKEFVQGLTPGSLAVDRALKREERTPLTTEERAKWEEDQARKKQQMQPRQQPQPKQRQQPRQQQQPRQPYQHLVEDLGASRQASRHQPAKGDLHAIKPRLERMHGEGRYICMDVVWDPDTTESMSAGNIRHQLISWVKEMESRKDHRDLGTLGKPRFKSFDASVGMASILVASSNAHSMSRAVTCVDGEDNDASA